MGLSRTTQKSSNSANTFMDKNIVPCNIQTYESISWITNCWAVSSFLFRIHMYSIEPHFSIIFINFFFRWGQNTITRFRPDVINKFSSLFNDEADNKRIISAYIFHCNVHNPTGEAAFHNLMKGPAYAKVRCI